MATRHFEHEGRAYVVTAAADPADPNRVRIEATADGAPVPIPGLPEGTMPLRPPHDLDGLLRAAERLLRGQPR